MEVIQKPKILILVYGIPASGKTYFSKILKQILVKSGKKVRLVSVDCIQAFMSSYKNLEQGSKDLRQILTKSSNWQEYLQKHQIQRNSFSAQCWKQSRDFIRNYQSLDIIFSQFNTENLIIEDEMLLKSQRKSFRRYCFQRKIKFIDFLVQVTLDQALQNNFKRSLNDCKQHLDEQVINKSLKKLQIDQNSIIISWKKNISNILTLDFIQQNSKFIVIEDNNQQNIQKQLSKKQVTLNQKELDQTQIRHLISSILKNDQQGSKYFPEIMTTKQRASFLAKAKKIYVEKKRSISFLQILKGLIN